MVKYLENDDFDRLDYVKKHPTNEIIWVFNFNCEHAITPLSPSLSLIDTVCIVNRNFTARVYIWGNVRSPRLQKLFVKLLADFVGRNVFYFKQENQIICLDATR